MIPYDKKLHLLAGFAAGIFPAILFPGTGTGVALAAGLIKEYIDSQPGPTGGTVGTVDPMDVAATLVGGMIADAVAAVGIILTLA